MVRRYKRLDDWKDELIGKVYTFLTVDDVVQSVNKNGKKLYIAVCTCRCGNHCSISVYDISSSHTKSCGCYEKSKENSERHREINYKNKDKMSSGRKDWCKNNPDRLKEIGNKIKSFYDNNPEKRIEASERSKQWCKNNPDKIRYNAEKYKEWYRNNPDKVADMIEKRQLWREDEHKVLLAIAKRKQTLQENPSIITNVGRKVSEWYKNNPDKVLTLAEKKQLYYRNNPDAIKSLSNRVQSWMKDNPDCLKLIRDAHAAKFLEYRLDADYTKLIEVLHPKYLNDLSNGVLTADSIIETKCPICGNYDSHKFHNVFVINRSDFRSGSAPLCKNCLIYGGVSKYEQEITDYISTFYDASPIRNSREIIAPLELDLYYPEKKIAIEFNGDYWHSNKFKDKDYHYNKFKLCKDNNIILVSIFETHWLNNQYNIKNYLYDLFNNIENDLSYKKEGCISNNYPVSNIEKLSGEYIPDSYNFEKYTIYTCGYTKVT